MKTQTINTEFHASDLPAWAQRSQAVVRRCESDLGFRANVYRAETAQERSRLTRDAERLEQQRANL